MRFVEEFEALQCYSNTSAKSTPKKSPPTSVHSRIDKTLSSYESIISGNITARSRTQSPEVARNHISHLWASDGDFLMDPKCNSSSLTSTRSNSPVFLRSSMGCKSLTRCENNEIDGDEDGVELMASNLNSTSDSSFDLHPPLLPTFTVTPPRTSRNAAYELAKFLRSSFHVKRAKITHLQRSISVDESLKGEENNPEDKPSAVTSKNAGVKAKKKILQDTTNCNSGDTRIFHNNTSPFRRVWETSSLRSPRSDKYTVSSPTQSSKNPDKRCSTSMITSDNDVFLGTAVKDGVKRSHFLPLRTHSEKVTSSNSHGKTKRVAVWAISFEHLLEDAAGLATFAEFLKLEFSAENIYFWTSCERYRTTECLSERRVQAKQIFDKFLSSSCPEPVNLDSQTRNLSVESLENADKDLFVKAQKQIFHLMKFDSYQRFIRSDLYKNCQNAEEKNQPLPYGSENLDALLKTNFLQSASPKLKKSASNAEDRRRKIILPWHRKTRSKSRDRMDVVTDDIQECSDGSNTALNTLLAPAVAGKLTQAKSAETLRSSLPSSLKSLNTACSLCRVKFSDDATTIVQIKPNETVGQLVERLLEKRGLRYNLYDVVIKSQNKSIDLQTSSEEIAGEEVEIEQRVTFKLYLPDPKVISVKSKPKKYLHEVVRPILQKYNYDIDAVDVLKRDTMESLDLAQFVTTIDGQRLHVVLRKTIAVDDNTTNCGADYQNDNIASHYMKSKELANEFTARNAKINTKKSSSVSSSEGNLNELTNNMFQDIMKDTTQPNAKSQPTDQYSLKSDEGGSEISVFYDTLNNKKGSTSNLRSRSKNPTFNRQHSSEGTCTNVSTEWNKPIIAKLKAGVKLQVTERVAEKQDELLLSLKTRLDNHSMAAGMHSCDLPENSRNKESQNETALALRQIRSNLSPVNKPNAQASQHFINEATSPPPLPLERPPHIITRKCITLKRNSLLANDEDNSNHSEADETSAACKGPPPLPPKPKVLPTKPSNWGANNSD